MSKTWFQTCLSIFIIAPLFWTLAVCFGTLILILRVVIQAALFIIYRGKYRLISPSDATFGHKSEGNSPIIHAITIHKGRANLEAIRQRYDQVVFKYKPYPFSPQCVYTKLKRTVSSKWDFPCWKFPKRFDISDHVRLVEGIGPQDVVNESKLISLLGELIDRPMDEKKPQWEHLIIPCYQLETDICIPHFVSIYRIHHAYSDGVAFILLIDSVLADRKLKFAIDLMRRMAGTSWFKDLYLSLRAAMLGPAEFLHDLKMGMQEQSLLYLDKYSNKKFVGWSRPVDLEMLKEIKVRSGCSIPAILMTGVTGAIREYHKRKFSWFDRGTVPEEISCANIMAMLPVNEKKLQNKFAPFRIVYPLREESCCIRLKLTDETGRQCSQSGQPYFNYFVVRLAGCFPQSFQDFLSRIAGTPMVFSNVPGPVNQYRMFGGDVIEHGVWLPPLGKFGRLKVFIYGQFYLT